MSFYVVKCLDAMDYERWLGKTKTTRLDGVADERYAVPDDAELEYVWDWELRSARTIQFQNRETAQRTLEQLASSLTGRKVWVAKIGKSP